MSTGAHFYYLPQYNKRRGLQTTENNAATSYLKACLINSQEKVNMYFSFMEIKIIICE